MTTPDAPDPMTTDTAIDRLRQLLQAHGFSDRAPALSPLWEAVRSWVSIPVEGMDRHHADLILFESVLTTEQARSISAGEPGFSVSFTRQFRHVGEQEDAEGELEQILVVLRYEAEPELLELVEVPDGLFGYGRQYWGRAGGRALRWAAAVEADPVFQAAGRHPARALEISQGLL